MDEFTQKYNVDRKAVSRLLKVSVRTVDRYIKKKVLTAQNVGGRIWLNKDEVDGMLNQKINRYGTPYQPFQSQSQAPTSDIYDTYDSASTQVTSIDTTSDKTTENEPHLSTTQTRKIVNQSDTSHLYKNLYEEAREELNEKQERLEVANYRVGQLEAQLKNSVPLLEYHRESAEKKLKEAHLLEKIDQSEKKLNYLVRKLKFEEYNKKLFLTILLVILALQPLWLLFLNK